MNYIRNYCKSTAFDVIKTRCFNKTNLYTTSQKMLEKLNNIYNEFDAYRTTDATLHNLDFDINMQKKETFDEFLTRYIITIASLQLFEQQKIFNLTHIISRRFRLLTINSIKPTIFKNYVTRFRQCDLNMRLANKQHQHQKQYYEDDDYDSKYSNQSYSNSRNKSSRDKRNYFEINQYSNETREQLRHEGKCFRCQKNDYITMNENFSYRGKKKKNYHHHPAELQGKENAIKKN